MPIPVQHFEPLSMSQSSPLGYAVSQLPSVAQQSMQTYQALNEAKMRKAIYDQQAAEQAVRMKYLEPQLQANLSSTQADIAKKNQMAQLPLGGLQLPGPAGQALGVDTVGKMYGYNSPQYKMAKNAFDLDQNSQQQSMLYQQALTKSMPERYLTPLGRGYVEEARVNAGQSPTGQDWGTLLNISSSNKGNNISPYSPSDISDSYDMLRQKITTDPDARKRNLFATNIEKTLSSFKPETLVQYSGAFGTPAKSYQALLTPFGKESKNYDEYKNALQSVDLLTSQVRQFYGDSVQSQSMDKLNRLFQTGAFQSNPKQALQMLNTTIQNLKNEIGTYRDAYTGTSIYKGKGSSSPKSNKPLDLSKLSDDDLKKIAGG